MAGERLKNESGLAYAYFQAYAAMPPQERNLERLSYQNITTKKKKHGKGTRRSVGGLKQWSTKYEWVKRAAEVDAENAEIVRQAQIAQLGDEAKEFADKDFNIAKLSQLFTERELKKLVKIGKADADMRQYRSLMMGYSLSREFFKECVGFLDPELSKHGKSEN